MFIIIIIIIIIIKIGKIELSLDSFFKQNIINNKVFLSINNCY